MTSAARRAKVTPMNVELDPSQEREIEALARESGRTVAEVLRELVERGLSRRGGQPPADEDDSIVTRQRDAWERLHAELVALPVSEKAKGFSGADHDEVLYGSKK